MVRESAGGIVLGQDGKILLVEQHGNSWSFPKGQVEEGEDLRGTAAREIAEETGITDLEYVCDLGSYERRSIGLYGHGENPDWPLRRRTFFLFRTKDSEHTQSDPDDEITDVRWVSTEEALQLLTHPKDKEFLESVRGRIGS